jgi:hypothetical protein
MNMVAYVTLMPPLGIPVKYVTLFMLRLFSHCAELRQQPQV